MPHAPADPDATENPLSITPTQFKSITQSLQTLINLIMPLHQLLEAQTTVEDSAAARLAEVLELLGSISLSFQASAKAMTALTQTQTPTPALDLAQLSHHQTEMREQMHRIEENMQVMMDWLGTPPPTEVEPLS